MDLYQLDSSLRKRFTERASHFRRTDVSSSVSHHGDLSKFPNSDLLRSSSWSAVIHQPDQDCDPEDLPSTVDIDAIKEPSTPVNASAQTPADQLHGDDRSFELSDEQNAGYSGSDSDSDSDSGNSANENAGSVGESGSCSDSDSVSSRPSSVSSKGKPPSSRSSRSNSPPSVHDDQQTQFSVRETNFEQGGLRLKFSALKGSRQSHDEYDAEITSDSSESVKKYDGRMKNRKLYSLKTRNDCKNKPTFFSKDLSKFHNLNNKDSDSDSSSSSNMSPEKPYLNRNSKMRIPLKSKSNIETAIRPKAGSLDKNLPGVKGDRNERFITNLVNKRNDSNTGLLPNSKESTASSSIHSKYRSNKTPFNLPSLKLPQTCKLSEDSDESVDKAKVFSRSSAKKENNRDTIEKLAQQLTQPGVASDQLQVLNEEDLAAVLPDVDGAPSGVAEFELTDGASGKNRVQSVAETKKIVSSDSSSDAELFPKQKQIVRDVINSIHVDSDSSACADSSRKNKLSESDSSSNERDEKRKRSEKVHYSPNLFGNLAERRTRLNKSITNNPPKSTKSSISASSANKKTQNEVTRKRGRPPKIKRSSIDEIETYMRLDCTVSNVSPDSGIQSNAGSPSYHNLPSSVTTFNQNSRTSGKKIACSSSKSFNLSQKAVLSASKKRNIYQRDTGKNIEETINPHETAIAVNSSHLLKHNKEIGQKSTSIAKQAAGFKIANELAKTSSQSNSKTLQVSSIASAPILHSDLTLFQGKRGPGRPKKSSIVKVNGQTTSEKRLPLELDGPYEKSNYRAEKPPIIRSDGHPKVDSVKTKCSSAIAASLTNVNDEKKRKKGNSLRVSFTYQPMKAASEHVPLHHVRKEWSHKHKKHKKKESKEKSINQEVLKMIDDLIDTFNKKCVIEDRKLPKCTQRFKEKCKKRKHTEKMKHSDNEFECDIVSPLSVTTSITSAKRRQKKSAIETPKVLQTSEQRLPLKKRHYHVSSSSITNNNHQTNNESKNRNEKHSLSHSNDVVLPLPTATDDGLKITENIKSKADSQKSQSKADAPKIASKGETSKYTTKSESCKIHSRNDSQKITSKDTAKNEATKITSKTDVKTSVKSTNLSSNKKEPSNKNIKLDDNKDKTDNALKDVDNITTPPNKKSRTDEGKKPTQRSSVTKELLPFLPLRRSGRSISCSAQKSKKDDSSAQEATSKSDAKKNLLKAKNQIGNNKNSDSTANNKKIAKRCENNVKPDSTSTLVNNLSSNSNSKKEKKEKDTPSEIRDIAVKSEKSNLCVSPTNTLEIVKTPTKLQTTNKPQLITPLPSEPDPANASATNLKPPAGVFEPSKKLPSPLSKCKKTSIADVLSKLKEKLKDLDSPLKNTSALIEKIGVAKQDADDAINDRVLRSKRSSTESETLTAKKSKICKDMSIRLRKLSNSELVNNGIAVNELKPKLKRRKAINRTGFPVKKKKKRMKVSIETPETNHTNETDSNSVTDDRKVEANDGNIEQNHSIGKVKNESCDEQIDINDTKNSLLSQPIQEAVLVKKEITSEDEIKPVKDARLLVKNAKRKIVKQDITNRLLPTRCSARIYIKQQIRAREIKKSKKKAVKRIKTKMGLEKISHSSEKNRNPSLTKLFRPRECKKRHISRNKTDNGISSKSDFDKESKFKDDVDTEELSDTDSIKLNNSKKVDIPKWKKKYCSAGLFSDFYKEEKHNMVDTKNRYIYKEEDHPHGLLPSPCYFDDWVRGRRVDFKLPYDLWWLHSHDQLPGRDDVVQSWNYKKIRTNVYYDVKPTYIYEAQSCNCKIPTEKDKLGCGEDCINRLIFAECSPQLCPLKQKCSNQKIQKHEWASKLVKFMTRDKGWGIKTKEPIKSGEFILEYVGEVVTDREFKKRMTSLYKNDIHHYCLNLDGGLLIDGHRMGGAGRFVNHSCEPNCEMQKWSVNGLSRMVLFASRDIEAEEELTYDYNFALFNPAEGQPCCCKSNYCRGVIGGKSQRVAINNANNTSINDPSCSNTTNVASNLDKKSNRLRPRKQIRKNVSVTNVENTQNQRRDSVASSNSVGVLPQRNMLNFTPVKPLTPDEKKIVLNFRFFLLRNLVKIQRFREKLFQMYNNKENSNSLNQNWNKLEDAAAKESAVFLTQLNALSTQRFIRTRRLAQAQDNPEMTKTARLAKVFRTIYNDVVSAKDEKGEPFSSLFMNLPSKRKLPMYYQRIGDPIDLTTIEKNIVTGLYKSVELFDKDMNKLIMNSVKYYGRTSDYGIAAVRLRKEYNISKLKHVPDIKEIIGEALPASFMPGQEDPGDEEEEVIRCICGLYNDEGLMILCERCLVWQHCDCVKADTKIEHYLCERCSPRDVDYDISLDVMPDYAKPGEKHYLTLMRDDLQIRQGDTVYVLRDILNPETKLRHTFRTIKKFKFEDCDIFRVERLWINAEGERMAFGHHYLRPHETFHEPTRKFFPNEVVKVPLYETVPFDLIMGQCYVLDLHTYRKGRPIDSDPQHIYICEFRVDKQARLFYKLPKSKQHAVCTKNFAFDKYDTPLKPARTYAPFGEAKSSNNTPTASLSQKQMGNQKARTSKIEENIFSSSESSRMSLEGVMDNSSSSVKIDEDEPCLSHSKDSKLDKQKHRLNTILLKLLAKKSSTKTPLDASYLLDLGRRNRKKPDHFTT